MFDPIPDRCPNCVDVIALTATFPFASLTNARDTVRSVETIDVAPPVIVACLSFNSVCKLVISTMSCMCPTSVLLSNAVILPEGSP